MSDSVELLGRSVLVTGASSGIGEAVARQCSRAGARVLRLARSAMPELVGAEDFRVDLTNPGERQQTFDLIMARVGCPDYLVSAAGTFSVAALVDSDDALVAEQLELNLVVPFALARYFLPRMQQRGNGRHLLIGSVADHQAFPGNTAYAASKYGLRGMHQCLLEEYRNSGVLCSLLSPGPTDTSIWDRIDPDNRPGFTPRARMLRADDVAAAVLWVLTRPARVAVDWLRLGPA